MVVPPRVTSGPFSTSMAIENMADTQETPASNLFFLPVSVIASLFYLTYLFLSFLSSS